MQLAGAVTYAPLEDKFALTFDHYTLSNYQNAFEIGKIAGGFQLLARGFGNMFLLLNIKLGDNKFFPLLSRNVLKGDSLIVFNKDVKIADSYVVRDTIYDYVISADEKSTKVVARDGAVIQDSGGMPL